MLGRTVSHYRISQELGRGGMGVVYKAEDLRLGRTVALKFLPENHIAGSNGFESLWREARALSNLSSPRIGTVYELGEADGQVFIAMEFIPGETLRERIVRKPLRTQEIVDIGIQISEGLEAAHSRKIIHQDIKAANILLNERGEVKIMDFGLARVLRKAGEAVAASSQTTLPLVPFSTTGAVGGTLSYMSPEQTRGEDLDERTDLFSFGVVLYEMATGQLPFQGDTTETIVHAIRNKMPAPASDRRSDLPADLAVIIDTALEKNRDLRYQSAAEMRAALARLKRSSSSDAGAGSRVGKRGKRRVGTREKIALLCAALALAAILVVLISRTNREKPFQNLKAERITGSGGAQDAAISPDGNYIVYVRRQNGRDLLALRHIPSGSTAELASLSNGTYDDLTYSPDSTALYYLRQERVGVPAALYRMPPLGGTATKVLDDADSATFSPDGAQVAFVRSLPNGESGLFIQRLDGTPERKLLSFRRPDVLDSAAWSPDGKRIAFGLISWRRNDYHESLHTVSVQGGADETLGGNVDELEGLCWTPDGEGLLVSKSDDSFAPNQLYYVAYPSGEARQITRDVNEYRKIRITKDARRLVSILWERRSNLWLASLASPKQAQQISSTTTDGEGQYGVAWTSDGRFIYTSRAGGHEDLWIKTPEGRATQLTTGSGAKVDPCVTGDDRYIVFTSTRNGASHIWRMELDGSHPTQLTNDAAERWPSCSADGKWVFYSVVGSGEITSWKIPVEGGTPVRIYDGYASRPQLSPDGRYIAFRYRNEKMNPRRGFAVIPLNSRKPQLLPEITGVAVRWSKDSKSLFFLKPVNGVTNVWVQPVSGESPKPVTDFQSDEIDAFDLSRDGQRLLIARAAVTSDVVLFTALNSEKER